MTQPNGQPLSPRSSATPGDLALVALLLRQLKGGADLRQEKIRRIRRAIRFHDYENSLKLDIAAERMVEEIRSLYSGH